MAIDTQLFYLFNNLAGQSPLFDAVVVFFASYLAYILTGLFIVLVFLSQYPKRKKLYILLMTAAAVLVARFGVTELIRIFYQRPRPFLTLPAHRLLYDSAWSFPSSHATFFFAMSTIVYLYSRKWGVFFFVATILMTSGRVIAGIHYPSDILGGAVIGIVVAYATFYLVRRVAMRGMHETS